MVAQAPARHTSRLPRRRVIIASLLLVQVLLMGAAFVGGRLFAEQNRRQARGAGFQLPAELPKDQPAGSGTVSKIQDQVITLSQQFRGGQGGGSNVSQTEVQVSADTKYYKQQTSSGSAPGGGQPQVQVSAATLEDVKVGNNVSVWGTKNGTRITAEVVYIQNFGR